MSQATLKDICDRCEGDLLRGSGGAVLQGITQDSRQVRTGFGFVARAGGTTDGHDHICDAVTRGAAAIFVTRDVGHIEGAVPVVKIADNAAKLAALADAVYGEPACGLIGITGTNGKTTTSYIIRHFLTRAGIRAGVIGTVAYEFESRSVPATRTTPDVFETYHLATRMARSGADMVVMEVSSHALAQGRIGNLMFDAAVFTNLTQDHLDYHHTMDEYFRAKRRLFKRVRGGGRWSCERPAVVGCEDAWGRRLATECREEGPHPLTYCLAPERPCDVRASDVVLGRDGSRFALTWFGEDAGEVRSRLLGRHNIANCLAAMAVTAQMGIELDALREYARDIPPVPGRLEFIPNDEELLIVVDYAHTHDALRKLLQSMREVTERELWTVVGCGGDRDRTKRPLMASVAEELSDHLIVTSDNPRTEDPRDIIADMREGLRGAANVIEPERRAAIRHALQHAQPGDTVVIAGKGHETYQEVNRVFHAFDDRAVAREELKARAEHAVHA